MAACAEDVEMNNRNAQYITFNVTDQNYLPDPVEDTRSAQASPFEGEAQEFTPQNSLFTYNTATKTPTIDQTPVETDLDEDLCLITTVEDGIHLDNAAATTRGGQVSSGTFSFGVTEYKNGGSVVSTFNNVQFSGVTVSTSSQKVNTGKTWESDAGSSNYDFYACYPYLTAGAAASNGLSLAPDCKTITYDCSSVTVANQQDLMTAYASSAYNKDGISLAFGHRLCAVKIVLSSSWNTSYTIKSINFSSIKKSGTYNIANNTWGSLGTAGSYDVSGITSYPVGFKLNDVFYAGIRDNNFDHPGDYVSVNLILEDGNRDKAIDDPDDDSPDPQQLRHDNYPSEVRRIDNIHPQDNPR